MIAWEEFMPGNHRVNCLSCGRKPGDKTMGITIAPDRAGVAHCFRCSYVATYQPGRGDTQRPGTASIRPTKARRYETLSQFGRALWDACVPVHGAALSYLTARHCVLAPRDGDLRCHPALKHPSGHIGPALVALVTDALTGQPLTLHRTWIQADGRKADVDPPRLLLGGHRKQGGVIRLWPDEAVTCGLTVAEGIETALSLAHAYTPAWACIDANNLASLPVLPGIQTLLIGADNDPAGQSGASECAARWTDAGVEVLVTQQKENDVNDALQEAA
jgi:putative DNA primase/helicase